MTKPARPSATQRRILENVAAGKDWGAGMPPGRSASGGWGCAYTSCVRHGWLKWSGEITPKGRAFTTTWSDPMEKLLAEAMCGRIYFTESAARLDFYLPDGGLHIEVKRLHSDRIGEQMSRVPDVIAVQGEAAVRWLADLIRRAYPEAKP